MYIIKKLNKPWCLLCSRKRLYFRSKISRQIGELHNIFATNWMLNVWSILYYLSLDVYYLIKWVIGIKKTSTNLWKSLRINLCNTIRKAKNKQFWVIIFWLVFVCSYFIYKPEWVRQKEWPPFKKLHNPPDINAYPSLNTQSCIRRPLKVS